MKNIRIIHNNIADTATFTALYTNPYYPVSNMKKDIKSKVWKSTNTTDTLTTFNLSGNYNCVILAFTNVSAGAALGINIISPGQSDINYLTGQNKYSLGNTTYARVYFPLTNNPILSIQVQSEYAVEISRLIIGEYWSPKFNIGVDYTIGVTETATSARTVAGNLLVDYGTRNKSININFPYLLDTELDKFYLIQKSNKGMFVSLFPESADENKEQIHQVYGKRGNITSISHPMHTQFASSLNIEEV